MFQSNSKYLNLRLTTWVLMGAFVLSGCGIKGDLKTPPPLWGDETKTQTETEDSILDESPLDNDPDDLFEDETDNESPF